MKDFWMVVQTFPNIEGALPMVIGAPHPSYDKACEEAIRLHLKLHAPVVVMHSVAIADDVNDVIPSIRLHRFGVDPGVVK